MSWAARITPTETGFQLRFGQPVSVLDMTPAAARELAALLLVAAEGREPVVDEPEQSEAAE